MYQANRFFGDRDLFEDVAVKEVENMRRGSQPFFLLIHTDVTGGKSTGRDLWEQSEEDEKLEQIRQEMYETEYRYKPNQEWAVRNWEEEYRESAQRGLEGLKAFYDVYRRRDWDRDTLFILTADHGRMFENGKVWYNFHPDEAVARVPLIISGVDQRGTDERLFETVDLTQSILSIFGVEEKLFPEAVSLLNPLAKKMQTTTITHPSKLRNEIILNIYSGQRKYMVRFHDEIKGINDCYVEGFETICPPGSEKAIQQLPFDFLKILRQYGFKPTS